jgi:hypothetical protein
MAHIFLRIDLKLLICGLLLALVTSTEVQGQMTAPASAFRSTQAEQRWNGETPPFPDDILFRAFQSAVERGRLGKVIEHHRRSPSQLQGLDSLTSPSSTDTSEFISWSDYKWADDQRYTLTGQPPRRYTKIQPALAAAYLSTYVGLIAALHYYQKVTFWSSTQTFRIRDNWDESLGANYFGHAIAGYFISYLSEQALLASGVSYKLAPLYGGLLGLGYQVYVEVLDGFGTNFSLSPYEMYSNILGCTYFVLTQEYPSLQNWMPKYSFYPASSFGELAKVDSQTPIDDYSAWNFWVSANINNLTNGSIPFWPKWLNLAIGYGARNLGYPEESRLVTLALDYDLVKLLPDGPSGWNWFKQTLNFVKLPSPTIEWRFSREWKSVRPARFYLTYPFPIKIGNVRF